VLRAHLEAGAGGSGRATRPVAAPTGNESRVQLSGGGQRVARFHPAELAGQTDLDTRSNEWQLALENDPAEDDYAAVWRRSEGHDLDDMFYFAKVVEHGGFAAAGLALRQPKSRLSRRLGHLVARLSDRPS
jgi:hypothetical protein